MGFEIGFDKIEKFESINFSETLEALDRIEFSKNKWNADNYISYEEYYKANNLNKLPLYNPSNDVLDFYKDKESETLDYWCSIGKRFDEEIKEKLTKISTDYYLIKDKSQLDALLTYFKAKLEDMEPEPAMIMYVIKKMQDGSLNLSEIDGIQVELDTGEIKQILFDEDSDTTIYVNKKYVDSEEIYAIKHLIKCLEKIQKIDLDKYFVYYWRSY